MSSVLIVTTEDRVMICEDEMEVSKEVCRQECEEEVELEDREEGTAKKKEEVGRASTGRSGPGTR